MGFGPKGCDLHHQLSVYHRAAEGKAVIDYSFHGVIQRIDEGILAEMASMVSEEGISSFKFYLTYGYKLGDADVLIFPDFACANAFYKGLALFAGAEMGGILQGTEKPCVLTSRSDSTQSKFYSIAIACILA